MSNQFIYFCVFCVFYALIVLLCEFLYRKGLEAEYSRKLAHFLSTLSSLFFPFVFKTHWYVLVLGIICFIVLFKSSQNVSFPSIDSVKRKTYGSYLLPVSICIIYYVYRYYDNMLLFILPILILAISDSMAGIVGKIFKSKKLRNNKTILGTSAFFLFTFIIAFGVLYYQMNTTNVIIISLGLAFITTIVELFSPQGVDNLTIPLCAILFLLFSTHTLSF